MVTAVPCDWECSGLQDGWAAAYALQDHRDWLPALLAEQPDITLRALAAELAERGIKVSYFAVGHFFDHEGISFKSLRASEQDRADVARRRRSGRKIKAGLILPAWSSSMKPGPRPT